VGGHLGAGPFGNQREFAGSEFVGLGQDDLVGNPRIVKHEHQRVVYVLDAMARIDQQADPLQRRAGLQIAAQQGGPTPHLDLRRFGIAVTRQIHEHQAGVEIEEVDLPSAAWGVRGSRERSAPGQRVDEAGLADVRASGKGDLGQRIAGKRGSRGSAGEEAGLAREKTPSDFDKIGI
jgi:hypothetical protein